MKKYTTEEFIKKSQEVHGDKYDYSKVEYVDSETKVCIICPDHGEFFIKPGNHLYGQGCRKCGIKKRSETRKKSLDIFIEQAHEIHGDKYDYSKIEYKNCDTKICIICPKHGEFWQTPYHHLKGCGCPKCNGGVLSNKEEFIKKALEVHGDKYDYSKVEYVNSLKNIKIICHKTDAFGVEHGIFEQTPSIHLKGCGCQKCSNTFKYNNSQFIKKAQEVHGDKYDYSKVNYVNANTKICIICPEHGEFWQTPHSHLVGRGCPICKNKKNGNRCRSNTEEFIKKSQEVHGDKYDYSKVNYVDAHTKICIICPKHGEFWQTPNDHLSGSKCLKCHESVIETKIRVYCEQNNIEYIKEKTFKWLGKQKLDFYLPKYNVAIECHGIQHFKRIDFSFWGDNFEHRRENDIIKLKKCKENKLPIYYYTNLNYNEFIGEKVYNSIEILFNEIINNYGRI